ncbi:hypothetical protein [Streptomyces sp. Z26]|uniref:hypothetical protein n=1 Tax=Streptomyces sp. Z26 TaxID=2500177 RepID=UPI000EF16D3E|nr:hypothetical protein [Streptomyces sp. Z26]RLL68164.1 hypothetical protein D7M15_16420 [Streptomyces sp. Z26]
MSDSTTTATAGDPTSGRPAPSVLVKDEAYWARVRAIVDTAPPLTDEQKVRIRAALHSNRTSQGAAA